MAYGVGWGSSPWGGSSASASAVVPVFYDIEVDETPIILTSDIFVGVQQIPAFIVGAQSPTKVEVVFSVAMSIDSNFTNPARYLIRATEGGATISVTSVEVSGPAPLRRATLHLGSALESKEYYSLVVASSIVSLTGDPSDPDIYIFQWSDMTTPVFVAPLEIPIRDFSGEVRGGLLGNPDGQVFFTPAYETVSGDSTIELESVSVCTRAYDEYHIPDPPDPAPLLTWRPGITTVIGAGSVLWAPADRLGLPSINLAFQPGDFFQPANDFAIEAELVEPIDITKAGFLNDPRWKTFPATGATVFRTASNLTFIGPGPTTPVTLDWPKIVLSDSFPITDQIVVNILDVEIVTDSISIVDGLTVQNITVGFIAITVDEAISLADSVVPSTTYSRVLATDAMVVPDTVSRDKTISRAASDTITITDTVIGVAGVFYDVVASDTATLTDQTSLSLVYALTVSDTVSTTDQTDALMQGDVTLDDTLTLTDSIAVQGYFTYSVALSDNLVLTDAASFDGYLSSADSVTITESASLSVEYAKTLSDTLSFTDALSIEVSKGVGDTVSVTDTSALSSEFGRAPSESITLTDTIATTFEYDRTPSESITLTDTIATNFEYSRSGADAVVVTDASSTETFPITVSDTLTITDACNGSLTISNIVADETPLALTEVIWTGASVQLHDTTFSPAGLWQFNETLNDSSGNGLHFTIEAGSVNYGDIAPGVKGVILDGASTALIYGTSSATLGTLGDISIEMLISVNLYGNLRNVVSYSAFPSGASTNNTNYCIELLSTTNEFTWVQESGSNVPSRTANIISRPPLNQLCHFAMTRRSNVIRTYINGILVDTSSTLTAPTGGSNCRLRVATQGRGWSPPCTLASLKIVSSGLTDTQIAAEYNRTMGRLYGEI